MRFRSIGELVAGIAHELNNPLTIIKSSAYLLQQDLAGAGAEDARIIADSADRAAKIVRNLLHFARQSPPARHPLDLNEIVERVLHFREEGLATRNVRIKRELTADLPLTVADPAQLEQVVLSLVNNGEWVMTETDGEGVITIRTRAEGDTVRLAISDTGPGLSPEALPRIFDPFFTTRSVGKGTGLGLAVSHGIVAEHGGTLWAESEPGRGATFFVELPAKVESHTSGIGSAE